jgi:hypothetical protein
MNKKEARKYINMIENGNALKAIEKIYNEYSSNSIFVQKKDKKSLLATIVNNILRIIGWCVGITGTFVFYDIARHVPQHFLEKYFKYSNESVTDKLAIVNGVITMYCHGTVAGLACSFMFPMLLMMIGTGIKQLLCCSKEQKNLKKSVSSNNMTLGSMIITGSCLVLAVTGALMRVGMYQEFTPILPLIVIAFISSMGMNFMGFTSFEVIYDRFCNVGWHKSELISYVDSVKETFPNLRNNFQNTLFNTVVRKDVCDDNGSQENDDTDASYQTFTSTSNLSNN